MRWVASEVGYFQLFYGAVIECVNRDCTYLCDIGMQCLYQWKKTWTRSLISLTCCERIILLLQDFVPQLKSQYHSYEDAFFTKVKGDFLPESVLRTYSINVWLVAFSPTCGLSPCYNLRNIVIQISLIYITPHISKISQHDQWGTCWNGYAI